MGGKLVSSNNIEFKTSELSKYGLLITDKLVSINTTIDKTAYTLNGGQKELDVAPLIVNDRTMVPIRFIAEAFGAEISWIDVTKTVNIELDGEKMYFIINGHTYPGMDVPAAIINDRVFVPLRYVSEKLGANIIWNADTRSIDIYR